MKEQCSSWDKQVDKKGGKACFLFGHALVIIKKKKMSN